MNTKLTLAAIVAAAGALAGVAIAQTTQIPPELRTSTAGNGCTATGNAMAGGNLGGSPNPNACKDAPAPVAAQPATVAAPVAVAPAQPMPPAPAAPAPVAQAPDMSAQPAPAAPMRVARADRG